MKRIIRFAVCVLVALYFAQAACALDLPWQKGSKQVAAGEAPKPKLRIPGADSDMFPRMDADYVGGKTIQIDALSIAVPEGWYRGEKPDEDDEEAYLFACVPPGSDEPVCALRIEYDINEMVRGAAQIPDFLSLSRKYLEEDGEWKSEPMKIGGREVQCLRNTDTGDETLLLVQYALKTYVPSVYVLVPARNASLPPEAAAFIAGIKQK